MKSTSKLNIADIVCVKLTRRGSFLLNEHYKSLNLTYNMNNKVDWKTDQWWCERLWVVVTTFQHYFKTTSEPPWTELVVEEYWNEQEGNTPL